MRFTKLYFSTANIFSELLDSVQIFDGFVIIWRQFKRRNRYEEKKLNSTTQPMSCVADVSSGLKYWTGS